MTSRTAAVASTALFRTQSYLQGSQQQQSRQPIDDYEPWYTQGNASNRMVLSLRSGIIKEVEWALDRLVRLSHNDQFSLKSMPGLLDALFEWPYHYVSASKSGLHHPEVMFAMPSEEKKFRRFGLASLFVLKNASVNDVNARELAKHPRTVSLVYSALMGLQPDRDSDTEFLVNSIEIFQTIAHLLFFPTPALLTAIIQRLETIIDGTSNRSLLICCISAITSVMQYTRNLSLFKTDSSPSFEASIRCLPLTVDVPLLAACLEYLFVRLSHPPLLRAFLLHPNLVSTLKVLTTIIISTQELEDATLDAALPSDVPTAPDSETPEYEMTPEEIGRISKLAEPQRSYDWLKVMFIGRLTGEVTQVDFWNLYKESFSAYANVHPMLPAAEVIKNVTVVFPQAQAMVLPGPTPRFVIRGIDRRKAETNVPKLQCHWDKSNCPTTPPDSAQGLYEHLLEHVSPLESDSLECTWISCTFRTGSKETLQRHVLTHIPLESSSSSAPQTEVFNFPSTEKDLFSRPPPSLRNAKIRYRIPKSEPTTNALTALLIIRLVYRISSATTDAVLRADEDHFGFPGIQQEEVVEQDANVDAEIAEGERRGRKAIAQIYPLLEQVKISDSTLMGWILEMIDASLSEAS